MLNEISGVQLSNQLVSALSSAFVLGIFISHLYREIIIRNDWLKLNIPRMIPRFILGSLAMALLFQVAYSLLSTFIFSGKKQFTVATVFQELAGWMILFVLWSLIYFFYHFFKNYKAEEIKNLKWEAARNEIELNKLKSQLNPHFIFNALNTIKGYYSENKTLEVNSYIVEFSRLLRNILESSGKLISIEKEKSIIISYLNLVLLRYSNEINFNVIIDDEIDIESIGIPPMLIQPFVENSIIHGVSNLNRKGTITIEFKKEQNYLVTIITDNGRGREASQLSKSIHFNESISINLTRQRLELIEAQNNVKTDLIIDDLTHEDGSSSGTKVTIKLPILYV